MTVKIARPYFFERKGKEREMESHKYEMNDVLKDNVSGYKGQVLGITFYSTGCCHYGLAPLAVKSDGSVGDWQWFDESRVSLVKKAKPIIVKPHSGPDMNVRCK